jgi:phospholipid/cholesterol/gamma-HCH transport system substrate-binding protein
MPPANAASKVRLGVFVVSGLVLGVVALLAFGMGRLFERTDPLHCYFTESVQGLEPGADIRYRGVKIGRVTRIAMRPYDTPQREGKRLVPIIQVDGVVLADALVAAGVAERQAGNVASELPEMVEAGLRVRLAWKDITGQKFLDVDFLDPKEYPPPDLGFAPERAYIPTVTGPSLSDIQKDLATTMSSLSRIPYEDIGRRINSLLTTTERAVAELDTKSLSEKFGRVADAMDKLASSEHLSKSLAAIESAASRIDSVAEQVDRIVRKPELSQGIDEATAAAASIRRTSESLEKDLPALIAHADETVRSVQKTVEGAKVDAAMEATRGAMASLTQAGRSLSQLEAELAQSLETLNDAARRVGKLAESLQRHPESLLSGRGAPKED